LIDVGGPFNLIMVIACSIVAMGCFVAATQNWLLTRNRWYETVLLLLICFTLFRPAYWLDRFEAPFTAHPAGEILAAAGSLPDKETLRFRVMSQNRAGEDVEKTVRLTMKAGKDGADRLKSAGLVLAPGDKPMIQTVRFGSEAAKYGLAAGDTITAVLVRAVRPSRYWAAIPALLLLAVIVLLQLRRRNRSGARPVVAAMARP
jgi:hypothetical protein